MSSAYGVLTFPLCAVFGYSGELILTATGTVTFPSPYTHGVGTPGVLSITGTGASVFPKFDGTGYSGGTSSVRFPVVAVNGVGYVVAYAVGAVTFPAPKLFGPGYRSSEAQGAVVFTLSETSGSGIYAYSAIGSVSPPLMDILGQGFILTEDYSTARTIVVNTKTFALSEFTNFGFNSFCEFPKGTFLGASSSGLFKLFDGDTDNGDGINAVLTTGMTDFGEENHKNCRDGVLNYRSDGMAEISLWVDEQEQPDIFNTYDNGDSRLRNYKFKMSKFRKGKNWQFSIANKDGSLIDISEFAVFYDVLSRRI